MAIIKQSMEIACVPHGNVMMNIVDIYSKATHFVWFFFYFFSFILA